MLQGLQALITVIEIVGFFFWIGLIYPERDRGLARRIGSAVGADHFSAEYSDVFAALSDILHRSLHVDLLLAVWM